MAVVLRCQRRGRRNRPFFRVVAADERAKNDGRVVEVLGTYDPIAKDPAKRLALVADRVKHWLGVGAQLTDTVRSLINQSGIPIPLKKKRERKKPAGKKGVGGGKKKPARHKLDRFKKRKGLLKPKETAAPAASTPPAEGEKKS